MTHTFTIEVGEAQCACCGTVSTDGLCDCRHIEGAVPQWVPIDREAYKEIERLRAENAEFRKDVMREIADNANCHLGQDASLYRSALMILRRFVEEWQPSNHETVAE